MTPEEFRSFRHELGMTQTQFAERLGYGSYTTVKRIENGSLSIPRYIQLLIAEIKKNRELSSKLDEDLR